MKKAAGDRLRRLPRNIWILTFTSFLTDVSSEMIVHLLPLFLANVLGVRTVTIGLIEGTAETTASLLKIWSGRISDRLGRRKWLTVAGYALSTISKPFLVIAGSWPAVLAVRFFERMGKGIRSAPRDALLADSIDRERRGLAFGLNRAGDTAGAAAGLLAAIAVVWFYQGESRLLARPTFNLLVWMSTVPAVLAVLLLAAGIREPAGGGRPAGAPTAAEPLPTPFRRYLVVVALFTLGNSSDAFLVLRAQERGFSVLGVMALLIGFNLIYAAISGPAGSLSDRIGRRRLLLGGWLFYALVYAGFALADAPWHVALLFLLYGIYYGLADGAARAFVADLVPAERRGAAYGWFNGAVGLIALPASLLAGLLWQGMGSWAGWGPQAPFFFGAALSLLAVLLFWRWFGLERPATAR